MLAQLATVNTELIDAIDRQNFAEVMRLNREFHLMIFDLSPLNQFRREAQRLWQLSEGYSTHWWWRTPEARNRINAEHLEIMQLLEVFDLDRLVAVCEAHRIGGHEQAISVALNHRAPDDAARGTSRVLG